MSTRKNTTSCCQICGATFNPFSDATGKFCSLRCYQSRPEEYRFWNKTIREGPIPEYAAHLGSCWIWNGSLSCEGYGIFILRGHIPIGAHVFSYKIAHGEVEPGKQIDHLCRVRCCVNPSHLEAVTIRVNVLRGEGICAQNARKTHCKRGHPFDGTNLRTTPNGERICRQCRKEDSQRRRAH